MVLALGITNLSKNGSNIISGKDGPKSNFKTLHNVTFIIFFENIKNLTPDNVTLDHNITLSNISSPSSCNITLTTLNHVAFYPYNLRSILECYSVTFFRIFKSFQLQFMIFMAFSLKSTGIFEHCLILMDFK